MNALTSACSNSTTSGETTVPPRMKRKSYTHPPEVIEVFSSFKDYFPNTKKVCQQWRYLTPSRFFQHYVDYSGLRIVELQTFLRLGAAQLISEDAVQALDKHLNTYANETD